MPKVSREPNNQSRAKTSAPAVTRPAARERHCDCSSAMRFLVRRNLVYFRRRKAAAANEPHVVGPRRLTSCERIGGLLTRHPRRPVAWSRQMVLAQTRGDEASRAQVRRPSRRKKSMSEVQYLNRELLWAAVQVNANVSWCKAKKSANRPPKIGAVAAAAAEITPLAAR